MSILGIVGLSFYLGVCILVACFIWAIFADPTGPCDELAPAAGIVVLFLPALVFILFYWCLKHTSLWMSKMLKSNAEMQARKREKERKKEETSTAA